MSTITTEDAAALLSGSGGPMVVEYGALVVATWTLLGEGGFPLATEGGSSLLLEGPFVPLPADNYLETESGAWLLAEGGAPILIEGSLVVQPFCTDPFDAESTSSCAAGFLSAKSEDCGCFSSN